MKYIRTKEGIFPIILEKTFNDGYELVDIIDDTYYYVNEKEKEGFTIKEKNVITQADTIEELCDEFVVVWNEYIKDTPYVIDIRFKPTLKELTQTCADNMDYEIDDVKKCYGAIWTDKGLIYVAKMNDKGELELL